MVKVFGYELRKLSKSAEVVAKVTAKEDFVNGSDWLRALSLGAVGGVKSKFVSDVYRDRILYPHEEMLLAKKAFNYNSYVNSAVRTRANFMTGGSVKVTSADKKTEKWLNEMLVETNLSRHVSMHISPDLINTGNGYLERIRGPAEGAAKSPIISYQYISTPERMYLDLDKFGLVVQYLQELPEYYTGVDFGTIRYYGDRRKTVKGKLISKEKIVHFKLGVAEIQAYGRGYTCSIINDIEILLEIERALAVIARYKAVPKKLIMLNRGDDTNGGKAAETYANQISNLSDIENPVIPELAQVEDLSYNGRETNFEPILSYLKKKITIALAPDFIMHGDETTYAVSNDQREAFMLSVQAEREAISEVLKKELKVLAKSYNQKLADFDIKFGQFDLGQSNDKKNYAKELYQSNVITLNEARKILGLPEDKENGEAYNNELNSQANMFGTDAQNPAPGENDNSDESTKDTEKKREAFK